MSLCLRKCGFHIPILRGCAAVDLTGKDEEMEDGAVKKEHDDGRHAIGGAGGGLFHPLKQVNVSNDRTPFCPITDRVVGAVPQMYVAERRQWKSGRFAGGLSLATGWGFLENIDPNHP